MKSRSLILFLVLSLTFTILLAGCGTSSNQTGQDDSLERIKKAGKFIVGLDDAFPPMGFKDQQGQIVGFDIDLAKEAAKRMGIEVEFRPVDWDGVLLTLNNGEIDVIWNGLTITEERAKQIAFTKPYITDRQIIVVKAGNDAIKTKADLAGKIVGLQMGSSSESALNADEEVAKSLKEIKKYDNNTTALMDLKVGRVDAVVVDEVVGRYYIATKPNDYTVLEDNFGEESFGVGIRQADKTFQAELQRVIDEMIADGTAGEISKKWFGEDIMAK